MLDALTPSAAPFALHNLAAEGFLFATGIENSAPRIEGAGSAATRWPNAVITTAGGRISPW
ncbi:hypothetical protein ACFQU2_04390 [Siccirubricoccus deserti]